MQLLSPEVSEQRNSLWFPLVPPQVDLDFMCEQRSSSSASWCCVCVSAVLVPGRLRMTTNERDKGGGSLFSPMFGLSLYILLSFFPHWLFRTEV